MTSPAFDPTTEPQHPDYFRLVELVVEMEEAISVGDGFNIQAYLAQYADPQSVGYLALQRAMGTMDSIEDPNSLIAAMPQLMSSAMLYTEGFILGVQFEQTQTAGTPFSPGQPERQTPMSLTRTTARFTRKNRKSDDKPQWRWSLEADQNDEPLSAATEGYDDQADMIHCFEVSTGATVDLESLTAARYVFDPDTKALDYDVIEIVVEHEAPDA